MIDPGQREEKGWHWSLFLGRQEGSPSPFPRGTALPWEREARPVVMELWETELDSCHTAPSPRARPETYRKAEGKFTHLWEVT